MKIDFKFSYPYESTLTRGGGVVLKKSIIDQKISVMKLFWLKSGKKIEKSIKKITGLVFIDSKINCYINSHSSLSDPLSLKIEENKVMENNLVHELIHVLFTQNYSKNTTFRKKWDKYWKHSFLEESRLTKSHILLHAVHLLVTKEVFPEREGDIVYDSKHKDYVRSWNIVLDHKAQNLVDKYL